jgi:hypothetical protein
MKRCKQRSCKAKKRATLAGKGTAQRHRKRRFERVANSTVLATSHTVMTHDASAIGTSLLFVAYDLLEVDPTVQSVEPEIGTVAMQRHCSAKRCSAREGRRKGVENDQKRSYLNSSVPSVELPRTPRGGEMERTSPSEPRLYSFCGAGFQSGSPDLEMASRPAISAHR